MPVMGSPHSDNYKCRHFLGCSTVGWWQQAPLKRRRTSTRSYGAISDNTTILIFLTKDLHCKTYRDTSLKSLTPTSDATECNIKLHALAFHHNVNIIIIVNKTQVIIPNSKLAHRQSITESDATKSLHITCDMGGTVEYLSHFSLEH
jgi:hypothetical protein